MSLLIYNALKQVFACSTILTVRAPTHQSAGHECCCVAKVIAWNASSDNGGGRGGRAKQRATERMLHVEVDTNAGEDGIYAVISRELVQANAAGRLAGIDFDVRRARLDLGDVAIHWTPKEKSDDPSIPRTMTWLIERKSWSDWCASIQDGRYREQKHRFLGSMASETVNMHYMIEGALQDDAGQTRGMQHRAANAAVLKTQLRDGFTVLRTSSIEHSGQTIAYLALNLRSGGFNVARTRHVEAILGVDRKKFKRKRDNLTESRAELFCATLSVIPGMSDARARIVSAKYPSPKALISADHDSLAQLECGRMKLGPTLAKRIKSLYCV